MSLVSSDLVAFGSLFSIVDPFTAVPTFLALVGTRYQTQATTGLRASATCFKIAGGILLFGVGLDMMRAKRSETRATKAEADGRRRTSARRISSTCSPRSERGGGVARSRGRGRRQQATGRHRPPAASVPYRGGSYEARRAGFGSRADRGHGSSRRSACASGIMGIARCEQTAPTVLAAVRRWSMTRARSLPGPRLFGGDFEGTGSAGQPAVRTVRFRFAAPAPMPSRADR
jgi:hypothetical protein